MQVCTAIRTTWQLDVDDAIVIRYACYYIMCLLPRDKGLQALLIRIDLWFGVSVQELSFQS